MKLRDVQIMPLIYAEHAELYDIIISLQNSISYLEKENCELRRIIATYESLI